MTNSKNFNDEIRIKRVKTKFEDRNKDLDKYPKHILDLVESEYDDALYFNDDQETGQ